jgi:APA family basic amino acid/polyamine antiporter
VTHVTEPARTVDRLTGGLSASFGAGLFLGLAPASALAGWWLVIALVAAAALAVLFALSTADRAPGPLGSALGILGRIAGAVAVAGTCGAYVLPDQPDVVAVTLVVVIAGVALLAPPLPPVVHRVAVGVVLVVLAIVVTACFAIAPVDLAVAPPPDAAGADDPVGLLPAAALLFVCFTGPPVAGRRTRLAVVGVVLAVCVAAAVGVLRQLGGERLALSRAPLRDALGAADAASVTGLLALGVTVACALALHSLFTDIGARASTLRIGRPVLAAAVLTALGALLLDPVHALVGAAVLLLGEAGFRVLAGRRRRA